MLLNTQSIIAVIIVEGSLFYAFRNIEIGAPCFQNTTTKLDVNGGDSFIPILALLAFFWPKDQ